MQWELSCSIENDLGDIAAYIAQDNPRHAVSFIQEIRVKLQEIHNNPLLYRSRPDIGEEARMTTIGSYVILFRIINDIGRIERVVYGGRGLAETFGTLSPLKSRLDQNVAFN